VTGNASDFEKIAYDASWRGCIFAIFGQKSHIPITLKTSRRKVLSEIAWFRHLSSNQIMGLFLILFFAAWSSAQVTPQCSKEAARTSIPEQPLAIVSTTVVPSLPSESMALPVHCSDTGKIVVQLATMQMGPNGNVDDPVAISSDGKSVTRFGREKINDIPQPIPLEVFLEGDEVYVLTLGRGPEGDQIDVRTPKGNVEHQRGSTRRWYVAHFQADGNYAGAVPLDLPFRPMKFGVFANGDFLIAGANRLEPRAAIVGSNGQLRVFLTLKGDVHLKQPDTPGTEKDSNAFPAFSSGHAEDSLTDVLFDSQIVREDDGNLILFRPTGGPVFSISPSGEVRVQKLDIPGEFRLYAIKPSRGLWIVELTRDLSSGPGEEFDIYAFDPNSGTPLRRYALPQDLGFGLACSDGVEFTFVMANPDGKGLKLLKLAPAL